MIPKLLGALNLAYQVNVCVKHKTKYLRVSPSVLKVEHVFYYTKNPVIMIFWHDKIFKTKRQYLELVLPYVYKQQLRYKTYEGAFEQ